MSDETQIRRLAEALRKMLEDEAESGESQSIALGDPDSTSSRPADGPATGSWAPSQDDAAGLRTVDVETAVGGRFPLGDADRFAVKDELARGGLGRVLLARDERIGRDVAVKELLAQSLNSPERVARFLLEAQITGKLEHPGIVPIYELGLNGDGSPYYAMKLVRGRSLATAIEEMNKFDPTCPERTVRFNELLNAFVDVCHAMSFAHSRKIIHRDLKPGNVMLGDFGEAIVVDWGLAKELDGGDGGLTGEFQAAGSSQAGGSGGGGGGSTRKESATQAGSILGTPAFMPPEQASGKIDELDHRADVFALGAILYHILTGRAPYLGASVTEVLQKAQAGRFELPGSLAPSVPRALEAVCVKAMSRRPAHRYSSAKELAADVACWQAGEAVSAYRDPWTVRLFRWGRRHRTFCLSAATSAMVATLAVAGWRADDLHRLSTRRQAVLSDFDRSQQLYRTGDFSGARDVARTALTLASLDSRLAPFESSIQRMLGDIGEQTLAIEAQAAANETLGDFRRLRDEAFFGATVIGGSDPESDRQATQAAAAMALELFGISPEDEGTAHPAFDPQHYTQTERVEIVDSCRELLFTVAETTAQSARAEPANSGQAAKEALRILERTTAFQPELRAFQVRKVRYLEQAGLFDEAVAEAASPPVEPTVAADHFLLGADLVAAERYEEARVRLTQALRSAPDRTAAQYLIAVCDFRDRQWTEAIAGLTACESRGLRFVGIYTLRGMAYAELGDAEASDEEFERIASGASASVFANEFAMTLGRGLARLRLGKADPAIADFRAAIRLQPEHPGGYVNLSEALWVSENAEESLAAARQAVAAAPSLPAVHAQLARIYERMGDDEKASAAYGDAIDRDALGSSQLARNLVARGSLLIRAERYEEALADAVRAGEIVPDHLGSLRVQAIASVLLRRNRDALAAFDRYLELCETAGVREDAEDVRTRRMLAIAYRERGLARAIAGDDAGAMADYTRSLQLAPETEAFSQAFDRSRTALMRTRRGWSYLLNSAKLAEADFDAVIRDRQDNGDPFAGRGFARALQGRHREAVEDAEQALQLGPRTPGMFQNAACIYAQSAARVENDSSETERTRLANDYRRRAVVLLQESFTVVPVERRSDWLQAFLADPALDPIREHPQFKALVDQYSSDADR